jgi:predicted transcriptional regulator
MNNTWIDFYKTYGVRFSSKSNKHFKTECFDCGEDKLYVNSEDGTYVCKLCDHKGNNYSFIKQLHSKLKLRTRSPLLKRFSEKKGIEYAKLKEYGFVQDDKRLYIPRYGVKGTIVSLQPFSFKNNIVLNVKGQSPRPNFWRYSDKVKDTYLFESDLDGLCFLLRAKGVGKKCNVVSFPGSATFKPEWVKYLKAKKTVWCFDHDTAKGGKVKKDKFYPGLKGIERAAGILNGATANLKWLNWEDGGYERPFDVRDLYQQVKSPKEFVDKVDEITQDFKQSIVNVHTKGIEPLDVTSFDGLCNRFSEKIELNPTLKRVLACSCATVLSAKTQGDPIWMFIVGPASSGKTTILDAFAECKSYTVHRSTLTKTSLVSGRAMDEDPSILGIIDKRCLMIKDLTMLLMSPVNQLEETFGTLRDAYDDSVFVQFGNGVQRHYENLRFSWLAGVTDIIHGFNKSDAGERFLKVDIIDPGFDESRTIRNALTSLSDDSFKTHLKAATLGFMRHMWETDFENNLPLLPMDVVIKITAVSQVISYMRTKIKKDREGNVEYRTRKEQGIRVAKQLAKLAQMLCVVFKQDRLSEEEFNEYILKIAFDTCTSIQTEITMQVMKLHKEEELCSVESISESLQISKSAVQNHMTNMQEVGFMEFTKKDNGSGRRGRNIKSWTPTDKFLLLWKDAGLNDFNYIINQNFMETVRRKKKKNVKTGSTSTSPIVRRRIPNRKKSRL